MQTGLIRLGLLAIALASAPLARAQSVITITFDEIPAGSAPGEQYSAQGIHFTLGDFGVVAGITNGDPGNWSLDGSNGPYFLGFNGIPGYSDTINLDFTASSVSVDVSGANGSQISDTFTLNAYNGLTLVGTQTVTLPVINLWQTVTITTTGFDRIQLSGNGAGFHPYGVDNLRITPVPEPGTVVLIGAGLLGLAARRLRRAART